MPMANAARTARPFAGKRWAYVISIAAVVVAAFMRSLLSPWLGEGSPFLLFGLIVFMSSQLSGPGVGALTAAFSIPLGLYFLHPHGLAPSEWNQLALFLFVSAAVILLTTLEDRRRKRILVSEAQRSKMQEQASRIATELELLIDSATSYAICMLDADGRIVIWNRGAERLFGWSESEALGKDHGLLFAAEDREAGVPDRHLAEARANHKFEEQGWRVRKDGSEFLTSTTVTEIRDGVGAVVGYGKVIRDITEEQANAASIEAREMHLRSILDTVPEAMVVIDDHGLITSFSSTAEELFGYSQTEVAGKNVSMLMPAPDHEAHDSYLARYRATGERRIIGIGRRVIGRRKDGRTFPLELAIGEAIGGGKRVFTGFMRDLTRREEADAHLQQLQAELLHISRVSAMGTMASTLAHELNQPLTAVANYVQTSAALLRNPDPDTYETVREALTEAGAEALRAGGIVQRLRDFVGRGEIDKTVEQVLKLIEDACVLGLAGAREKGITYRVEVEPEIGPIFIDRVQVQQVLINLVRNAVEAMAPMGSGEILISAATAEDFVQITVADTGPGLSQDVAKQLFQAFVSTKRDGMGLGLSICRTIIEGHEGKIWAEERPSGGALFHFTVPRAVMENADV